MNITTFTQNNYFIRYAKCSVPDKDIKVRTINYGQTLKCMIAGANNHITVKLNDIATRIQKRINRASLTEQDLLRYQAELKLLLKENFQFQVDNIKNFFKCCILLSKHDTQSRTKFNYFLFTNKTNSLKELSETNNRHKYQFGINFEEFKEITPQELESIIPDTRLANITTNYSSSIRAPELTMSIYEEKKFIFKYSSENLHIEQKLKEEDEFALKTIESKESKESVKKVAIMLADVLEKNVPESNQRLFYQNVTSFMSSKKGAYPVPKISLNSFEDIITILRTNDNHVVLLSLIWTVFIGDNAIGSEINTINKIYNNKIEPAKGFIEDKAKKIIKDNDRFGNSGTISNLIFSEADFYPFARAIDYITINNQSRNPLVQKFINKNIPYISGPSGMANMTCKALSKLGIHPFYGIGQQFCEAVSAFIVGSGMHSYYEVYKSFNLYAKEVHYNKYTIRNVIIKYIDKIRQKI